MKRRSLREQQDSAFTTTVELHAIRSTRTMIVTAATSIYNRPGCCICKVSRNTVCHICLVNLPYAQRIRVHKSEQAVATEVPSVNTIVSSRRGARAHPESAQAPTVSSNLNTNVKMRYLFPRSTQKLNLQRSWMEISILTKLNVMQRSGC